jgi:hypothetical protein
MESDLVKQDRERTEDIYHTCTQLQVMTDKEASTKTQVRVSQLFGIEANQLIFWSLR